MGTELTRRARRAWALGLLSSVYLLAALLAVPYLPTHDGPQHLYLAHLGQHYGDPGTIYSAMYRPTLALTALGFSLVYAPLAELMAWQPAFAVTLAAILLLWSWGYMALARAVRPERLVLGLFGFATAFQWALYMGLFSYLSSLGVGFFTIALAFRHREWRWRQRLWIAGLLAVQAVFHVFGAQVTGLVLLLLVLARNERRRWPKELGLLALMGLVVVLLSAVAAGWIGPGVALPATNAPNELSAVERLLLVRGLFVGGPAWRGWPLVGLGVVGLGCFARRWRARVATPEETALALAALVLLAVGLAAPLHLARWEYFSPRFLPPGVLFAVLLLPVEALRRGRAWAAAVGGVLVFSLASVGWAGGYDRALFRRCSDALSGLGQPIVRKGFRLPVILDSTCGPRVRLGDDPFPFVEPAGNLGALYAVDQGGAVPYTFALVPQLHPFVVRRDAFAKLPSVPPRSLYWWVYENPVTRRPPRQRREVSNQIAMDGSAFEDLVFYGDSEDRAVFLRRGYVQDFSSGRLSLLRFRGCPVTLSVTARTAPSARVYAELFWAPLGVPASRVPLSAKALDRGSPLTVPLTRSPCGKVAVRVYVDRDRSGGYSRGDDSCVGADGHGNLVAVVRPEGRRLDCVL